MHVCEDEDAYGISGPWPVPFHQIFRMLPRVTGHASFPSRSMAKVVVGGCAVVGVFDIAEVHAAEANKDFSQLHMAGAAVLMVGGVVVYFYQRQQAESNKTRPLIVSGPSGVGKGTLIGMLLKDYPERIGFSVSHTTRKPRPGEEDGKHYHFVTKEEIEEMIAQGLFVEHARVHSNIYGTTIKSVEDVKAAGKLCILDIDVQGAESVKTSNLDARFLFVSPPSLEALEARLRGRGTETEEKIQVRLGNASREIESTKREGFWDMVIINDDLQQAYETVKSFVDLGPPKVT